MIFCSKTRKVLIVPKIYHFVFVDKIGFCQISHPLCHQSQSLYRLLPSTAVALRRERELYNAIHSDEDEDNNDENVIALLGK